MSLAVRGLMVRLQILLCVIFQCKGLTVRRYETFYELTVSAMCMDYLEVLCPRQVLDYQILKYAFP